MHDRSRATGISLVEITLALSVFGVISVGATSTLLSGASYREDSFDTYRAASALRDFLADVQATANAPQNLTLQQGVGAIYDKYHDQTFTVSSLPAASITVTAYATETSVPIALGGPQDLNFDGDAQDDLSNQSNGADLRLVPLTLVLRWTDAEDGGTRTRRIDRLVAKTSD